MFALTPVQGRWSSLTARSIPPSNPDEKSEAMKFSAHYPLVEVEAGKPEIVKLKVYAGPKDIGRLENVGASLDRAIDLGDWLGPIARPILKFLRWLHGWVPNYGVAIILLTFLVRLAMFPLAQMQAKSMRKMQEHKPQLDALKEKYGENKEAYSRELMTYMRTHRINPMGGCLLLLPQLPIFFALYRVLYNSIELRHAPFILWIKDLSAHDPIFVMPILLGGVMFLHQRMTPTPGMDPAQAKIMKFMPVMFSFFMLFLPAGLNLYILISTLWGIGQQYWVQKGVKTVPVTPQKIKARQNGE